MVTAEARGLAKESGSMVSTLALTSARLVTVRSGRPVQAGAREGLIKLVFDDHRQLA
jgi:hypothetical protein